MATQEEKEAYIFLDHEGNASLKFDLYIHWSVQPQKELLVPCDYNESIVHLKCLIAESLQKLEALSGLSDLRVVRLRKNGKLIPDSGLIKQWLKPSDKLFCDVVSKDLWLDVDIDYEENKYLIQCQMKVDRNAKISQLRTSLVITANEHLFGFNYSNLEDRQVLLFREVLGNRNTKLKAQVKTVEVADTSMTVGDLFDYTNRKIKAYVSNNKESNSTNSFGSEEDVKSSVSVRKMKLTFRDNSYAQFGAGITQPPPACCSCNIF